MNSPLDISATVRLASLTRPSPESQRLLVTADAAKLLSMSPRSLERYRMNGSGPRFVKPGRRVLYRVTDLLEWLDKRTFGSTAEAKRVAV